MLSLSWRSMMSLIRSAKPPRLESCHRFFAPDRYPCDGRNVLRSSAWIAKQRADRLQRTEYKFWAVQQATVSPPKSFRDSQRTPAALNRAVARGSASIQDHQCVAAAPANPHSWVKNWVQPIVDTRDGKI